MSLPTSRHSYLDCLAYLDAALEDPQGIRLRQESINTATTLRMRIHQLRTLLRKDSESFYEPGDPKYGVTAYDRVVCRIRTVDRIVYLYLEQIITRHEHIEPLSDLDDFVAISSPEPQRLLEDLNATDRSQGPDGGNAPQLLEASLGTGNRNGVEDGSEDGVTEPPVRSTEVRRRI